MSSSLISVIVPAYNRAYCLRRAVDSVLRQTYPEIEVLIIDDGSTDGTRELVRSVYADDPRVRYLYQTNAGASSARNRGIQAALGSFIAFLDSDDELFPWKFAAQIACLRAMPDVGMIWTDLEAVGPDGGVSHSKYLRTLYPAYAQIRPEAMFDRKMVAGVHVPHLPEEARGAALYAGDLFTPLIQGNLVHTSTVLMTRERLARVRGFAQELTHSGEDYDFHLRTAREGRVAFLDIASVRCQIGLSDAQSRSSFNIYLALNRLKAIEPILQNDRTRIKLSDGALQENLIALYGGIAQAYFDLDQYDSARPFLLKALWAGPFSPGIWGNLFLTWLPTGICRWLWAFHRASIG